MLGFFKYSSLRNVVVALVCMVALFSVVAMLPSMDSEAFVYDQVPNDIGVEQERWKQRIGNVGAESAYEELVRASAKLSLTHQHIPAHAFGAALYTVAGIEGMGVCDERMLYGCFHEFLSHVIVENGISILPELERRCPSSHEVDAPISCVHGLGHGLVAYFGYSEEDLSRSIEACDTLSRDPWHACVQGAFMEYNLRYFISVDGNETRPIPDGDVYDPCDSYDGVYAERCVGLLPVWWRAVLFPQQHDEAFLREGEMCRQLPDALQRYRAHCFRGIGFTAVTSFTLDIMNVRRLCSIATDSNTQDHEACMTYATSLFYAKQNNPDALIHPF